MYTAADHIQHHQLIITEILTSFDPTLLIVPLQQRDLRIIDNVNACIADPEIYTMRWNIVSSLAMNTLTHSFSVVLFITRIQYSAPESSSNEH